MTPQPYDISLRSLQDACALIYDGPTDLALLHGSIKSYLDANDDDPSCVRLVPVLVGVIRMANLLGFDLVGEVFEDLSRCTVGMDGDTILAHGWNRSAEEVRLAGELDSLRGELERVRAERGCGGSLSSPPAEAEPLLMRMGGSVSAADAKELLWRDRRIAVLEARLQRDGRYAMRLRSRLKDMGERFEACKRSVADLTAENGRLHSKIRFQDAENQKLAEMVVGMARDIQSLEEQRDSSSHRPRVTPASDARPLSLCRACGAFWVVGSARCVSCGVFHSMNDRREPLEQVDDK